MSSFLLTISIEGEFISIPKEISNPDDYDFDHPSSLDFDYMLECLKKLEKREDTEVPNYCFVTHSRLPEKKLVKSADIIIFEGLLCMHDERIRDMYDLKLFVDYDTDLALARRIKRDIAERGRDQKEVITRYMRFIKHDYIQFVLPQRNCVNFIVRGNPDNVNAIKLLGNFIKKKTS